MPWSELSFKGAINKLFDDMWQRRWSAEAKRRNMWLFLPMVDKTRSKIGKSGRHMLNLICQAAMGHRLFAGHLAKGRRDIDNEC